MRAVQASSVVPVLLPALLFFAQISTTNAQPFDVGLDSKSIVNFKVGSTVKTFGRLEFIGGLEFTSTNAHVGALSGLALTTDQSQIIAVTDTGFWFTAEITRTADGRPLALQKGRMAPILDFGGEPFRHKWNVDAESITFNGKSVLLAFERDNRVLRYSQDLENFASLPQPVQLNIDTATLRRNKGLETVAVAPPDSKLMGAIIVISERSLAANGEIRGAIIDGPLKGRFTVKRQGKFDITDADFLPNGDLLLLERRFNLARGVGMRIRRVEADKLQPGASLVGVKLIEADSSYQIDNMEGLSVTTSNNGNITLSLVSDNNHSLLQRNLYLEFRLIDGN